jgi:hypothetical protein
MTIEQTITIPDDYRIFLELPRSVPVGVKAQVSIAIPNTFVNQSKVEPVKPVKSLRGILKGKGISIDRLREMQREDKTLEDATDDRQNRGTR